MNGASLEIWYDGDCELCRRSKSWCESRSSNGSFLFRDFRSAPDVELPLPRNTLEAELAVRDQDGELNSGFEAWRRILAELPRWRWLARLAGIPPLRWLGPMIYDLVSRRRGLLAPKPVSGGS
jgi:predicted DCC family thiol-disulfide oxidoreductase YuxK